MTDENVIASSLNVLVTVSLCEALVAPMATLPKLNAVGLAPSSCMPSTSAANAAEDPIMPTIAANTNARTAALFDPAFRLLIRSIQ